MADSEAFSRRRVLATLAGGAVAAVLTPFAARSGRAAPASKASPASGAVDDWSALSEADWRARLTDAEFEILREEGTERAGTSDLLDEKREGTYICAGCALPLFSSETRYDSGTGWPSFWAPLDGAMETKRDFKLFIPRTEYHCTRCGGHQGHVFDDGPEPTGQRWCNNGIALDFAPADDAGA